MWDRESRGATHTLTVSYFGGADNMPQSGGGFMATAVSSLAPLSTMPCEGVVTVAPATTGQLSDGNEPDPYLNNMDCTWVLESQEDIIKLTFLEFWTELSYDFVKVS